MAYGGKGFVGHRVAMRLHRKGLKFRRRRLWVLRLRVLSLGLASVVLGFLERSMGLHSNIAKSNRVFKR